MNLLLSIETATDVCAVALHQDGILLSESYLTIPRAHSQALALLVDKLLDSCDVPKSNLSGVIVSKGPGSYTGLRIGTSLAKGLCYALEIPLISVNTLEGMAQTALNSIDLSDRMYLCPMIDARRMEVYTLLCDQKLDVKTPTDFKIIDENSFSEELKDRSILFFGDGAAKCRPALDHNANAVFSDFFKISADAIGQLGFKKFLNGEFEDVAYFEPFYLKEFIAGKPKRLV